MFEPYFARPEPLAPPAYVTFRVGEDEVELGIINRSYAPVKPVEGPAGAVMYWVVDDLDAALERLSGMDATPLEQRSERDSGFTRRRSSTRSATFWA